MSIRHISRVAIVLAGLAGGCMSGGLDDPGSGGDRPGGGGGGDDVGGGGSDDGNGGNGGGSGSSGGGGDGQDPGGDRGCIDDGDPLAAAALKAKVSFLASVELAGRASGSAGDLTTRADIEARFRCLGLLPGADGGSYQQPFTDSDGSATANVIGYIPGTDPVVGHEIILIGGHHDHLGIDDGDVYPGANDNGSGTAAVLAVAQAIRQRGTPPRRTIAFVTFGAEEVGSMDGSSYFIRHSPAALPIQRVVHMVNLDMIGTYSDLGRLDVYGVTGGTPGATIFDGVRGRFPGLQIALADEPLCDSDHCWFCTAQVPYLYFFIDDPKCWHEPCDTADRMDYANMSEIVRLAVDATVELSDSTLDLAGARGPMACGS